MDNEEVRNRVFNQLCSVRWYSAERGSTTVLMPKNQIAYSEAIEKGVSLGVFIGNEELVLRGILKLGIERYNKVNNSHVNFNRRKAQTFLSKRNVRDWVFNRDGYLCLSCGSGENLSIDHIFPLKLGGLDMLSNLQTLCRSCNSKKSGTYIDFR